MFKNFLKTTFRNLLKNKTYSFLNIFGLALGISCAALIFLWVEDEVNYDSFNTKKDHLYLVMNYGKVDAGNFTHSSTPGVLGPALKAEIPGIANSCRVTESSQSLLFSKDDVALYASGRYVEPSFFTMFTIEFVEGNAKDAFNHLHSLVITEQTARNFFGTDKNIVGKTILVENKQEYSISGVIKDLPSNSTLQFEWLAPFQIYFQGNPGAQRWQNSCLSTYVELDLKASVAAVNKQLYNFFETKDPGTFNHAFLFNMNDWRLFFEFEGDKKTGGGRIEYVRMFSTIAWIILVIACINFMNLATARSEKRAKEVGVRKVLGAGKNRLVSQFLGEAIFMAVLAAVLAVISTAALLPAFNMLVEKNLTMGLDNPMHLLSLLAITIVSGLFAGSYPSIYLSSFNPVFVLKGIRLKSGGAELIRKGLVVFQFAVSIALIIGTIVIYQQIQHVKSRNLGFDKNNLIQINLKGNMAQKFSVIKQELINTGLVENVAHADHQFMYGGNNTTAIYWQEKVPNSNIVVSVRLVSPEYISTVGMKIKEGRDFRQTDMLEVDENFELKLSNTSIHVIVSETFAKLLGKGSAVGKIIQVPGDSESEMLDLKVVGVVEDYVYGYMYGKPDPVYFICLPQDAKLMYIRTNPTPDTQQTLAAIGSIIKKHNPAYPFEYMFVDDQFNDLFISEMLLSKLSTVFAALAILISCLGLFGLAAYTAESRVKEIGIRKVLGSSVTAIAKLLTLDFVKLVLSSTLIAFPMAWLIMNNWLEKYPYRIDISLWIFCLAGLVAIVIAILTISFQAVKAAVANPVRSLRAE